ncbi:peptidoglycan recognition protein 3-like [Macrosteles quadrilineatus]|uniref:peptidoglycan recognition protein 3-like n=1 Tax=Macrosteles quadrilineatus TaxID=74068 RepID=UPI0023E34CC2|nr:peptidoglycan recognition protein 3-like [Macrosteles quadrilineatus]
MFLYSDEPPEWAAEANKVQPTWPKVWPSKLDQNPDFQTDFNFKKSEVWVDPRYPFEYVKRFDWGAKDPKFFAPLDTPCEYLVTEMTGTHQCMFHEDCIRVCRKLQEQHMTEGKDVPDIKYSFLVGGNGFVYEGRGFDVQIYHTNPERAEESWQKLDWNGKCLIFAYIAPYDEMPNEKAMLTMRDLIAMALAKKYLKKDFLRIPGFFSKPDPKLVK